MYEPPSLKQLPDSTTLFPGHLYSPKGTTRWSRKRTNPYLRAANVRCSSPSWATEPPPAGLGGVRRLRALGGVRPRGRSAGSAACNSAGPPPAALGGVRRLRALGGVRACGRSAGSAACGAGGVANPDFGVEIATQRRSPPRTGFATAALGRTALR